MTGRPVDLARVRRALAALDELTARNPPPAAGPPTPDDVAALAADLEHAMAQEKMNERVGVRLSPDLRDRIERYRLTVAKTLPAGVREPTLSDAARMLILKGLEAIEGVDHG